ncbi:MAG: LAGLIDADG family homing endonuclease [Candidatus Pacebacteria bacterium]|nr:LAGLIDADG family homing endonuclease [Candidatus Paceibacterota bacterium]
MKQLSKTKSAYIAGFLDGDGSIYIRLKPNHSYHFGYQIAPNIVFYQSQRNLKYLEQIKTMIGGGYLRKRNDGIVEYVLGDVATMSSLLKQILPYLIFKKKQARLFLKILNQKPKVRTQADFIILAKMIDDLEKLNYSKKRFINSKVVKDSFTRL